MTVAGRSQIFGRRRRKLHAGAGHRSEQRVRMLVMVENNAPAQGCSGECALFGSGGAARERDHLSGGELRIGRRREDLGHGRGIARSDAEGQPVTSVKRLQ